MDSLGLFDTKEAALSAATEHAAWVETYIMPNRKTNQPATPVVMQVEDLANPDRHCGFLATVHVPSHDLSAEYSVVVTKVGEYKLKAVT